MNSNDDGGPGHPGIPVFVPEEGFTPTFNQNFRIGDVVGFNDPNLEIYAVGKVLQIIEPYWPEPNPQTILPSGYAGYSYVIQVPDGRIFDHIPDSSLKLIRHEMSA